jgi:hypothetical protein
MMRSNPSRHGATTSHKGVARSERHRRGSDSCSPVCLSSTSKSPTTRTRTASAQHFASLPLSNILQPHVSASPSRLKSPSSAYLSSKAVLQLAEDPQSLSALEIRVAEVAQQNQQDSGTKWRLKFGSAQGHPSDHPRTFLARDPDA